MVQYPAIPSLTLATLEFDAVRHALAERAATRMGADAALVVSPSADKGVVQQQLDDLEDALFGAVLHLGGISDIRPILQSLNDGRMVEGRDLNTVAHTLDAATSLRRSIAEHSLGPLLRLAEKIGQHVVLSRTILERLDRDGRVRDDASPKLRQLRRRLEPLRGEIRERLSRLMDKHTDALQERLVTIRRERFVIPVKASNEQSVPGIVVDVSATNQTVFIEPASVVGLNNELAKLLIEEEQEVARILFELSRLVIEEPGLQETLEVLTTLDVISAKAMLVRDWGLTRPVLGEDGVFDVVGLRHPLVENCVPNDVRLDATRRLLLITGPNMGGKTITLKSLGLACLMMQTGLYVGASNATLPVVKNILVDVGDGQSIEANLSTFAAHLSRLQDILGQADRNTLVLIDELGSGTDPNEGAALAQAILEHVLQLGARGIVTSHLGPLKAFASERQDVVNASMGFTLETLTPTYTLLVGQPGRSYALAIAKRLRFPGVVVARAETILGPEGQSVERLLEILESDRTQLNQELSDARAAREHAEDHAAQLRQELQALQNERDELLAKALERADGVFKDALEHVKTLKLRARENETERPKVLRELAELRAAAVAARPAPPPAPPSPDMRPGVAVEVPSYNASGSVLEVRGDEVVVQLGLLKVNLRRRDVRLKRPPANAAPKQPIALASSRFDSELNLRGIGAEDAISEVRGFVTEALALKESPIRILHGKGEGVLRRVIRDYLKTDKRIESFHDAQPNEGGHGVTVAHLRV